MKKMYLLSVLFCLATVCFSQSTDSRIDSLLLAYNRVHDFNGCVLVAKNGTVLLNKGYGYRNAQNKIPHDPQSIFQIGSVTKQFTTAVILKLQEQKRLSIHDHLSKYFPKYPKGDSITIEQLMLHTSGVYSYTEDRGFMDTAITISASREKMMSLFMNKPLEFSPGTNWKYSNSGYSLLGYIIEIVAGMPYEQVVHKLIFTPLKMNDSGFDFTHLAKKEKSTGYFVLNEKDTIPSPIVDSSIAYSAGAIYSTTGDLYRWHNGLQKNVVLSAQQQEAAYTPVRNNYGYGWGIDSIEGKRMVSHGGGIHGFKSDYLRIPADDICIIILSNAYSGGLRDITQSIYAILYNKPYELPAERKAISLPLEKLQEYEGKYQITPALEIKISIKDGQLWGEPTGQPAIAILAEKEDNFFAKAPVIQLRFTRDEKGLVNGFVLYQGGVQVNCSKIK